MWRFQYADGLKTGHTKEAGFCLVGSAKKDGMRLISVVMGEANDSARTEDSIRLLTYGFRFFETHKIYSSGASILQARVWQGAKAEVPLGIQEDLYVTVPAGQYKKLQANLDLNNPLKAPVVKGKSYGKLNIVLNNQVIASRDLIAMDDSQEGGFFRRATDTVKYNIHKYFSKADEKLNTG